MHRGSVSASHANTTELSGKDRAHHLSLSLTVEEGKKKKTTKKSRQRLLAVQLGVPRGLISIITLLRPVLQPLSCTRVEDGSSSRSEALRRFATCRMLYPSV